MATALLLLVRAPPLLYSYDCNDGKSYHDGICIPMDLYNMLTMVVEYKKNRPNVVKKTVMESYRRNEMADVFYFIVPNCFI